MNRSLLSVVIIILVVLGVWYFMSAKETAPGTSNDNTATTTDTGSPTTDQGSNGGTQVDVGGSVIVGDVKEFAVTASNFKFSVAEMKVSKGDRVRISLTNTEGTHDLVVDGYNARTKILSQVGASETIEFTADKSGTFEYYCSIGNHRQAGMIGKLIVQ